MKLGITRSIADLNLHCKVNRKKPLTLVLYVDELYVDDLFLTGADPLIHQCKRELTAEFEMKDLGRMSRPKGLAETGGDFPFSRKIHYEVSGMMDCKSMELNFKKLSSSVVGPVLSNPTEYRQLVGASMFLVNTRPDICFKHFESTDG